MKIYISLSLTKILNILCRELAKDFVVSGTASDLYMVPVNSCISLTWLEIHSLYYVLTSHKQIVVSLSVPYITECGLFGI